MSKLNMIPYIGGKYFLAPWIISHFPKHHAYIEVFGGVLNVLLAKSPANVEVVNDLNDEVYNLWCVIQSDGERLAEEADKLPYARKLYNEWSTAWHSGTRPGDSFLRALHFYYISRSGFSGKQYEKTGWSHSVERNAAKNYRTGLSHLQDIQNRLRMVQLEHTDFWKVLGSYDREDALFYVDPPYYKKECYTVAFSKIDHQNLAVLLRNVKGKVVLSYYPHPQILRWYPENKGWFHYRKTVRKFSHVKTGNNRLKNRPRSTATEILITNFQATDSTECLKINDHYTDTLEFFNDTKN